MIAVFIILILFIWFDPYIDISKDGIILWYGRTKNRKFIKLK